MGLVAIDIGLNGGICTIIDNKLTVTRMPTRTVIDKPAVTIFARDKAGNKVLIKSGPNKGTYKRIIKTKAKTHRELDCLEIDYLMRHTYLATLIIESPAMSIGNSSRSTASTNRNYGKLLALAETNYIDIIPVTPAKWKTALGLGRDKSVAIAFAEDLLSRTTLDCNQTTFTNSEDGLAEAVCIAYYYNKELLCLPTNS